MSYQTIKTLIISFLFISVAGGCANQTNSGYLEGDLKDGESNQSSVDTPEDEQPKDEEMEDKVIADPRMTPARTEAFQTFPNGLKFSDVKVRKSSLRLATGAGKSFTDSKMKQYLKMKSDSEKDPEHKVQWTFMNLDTHEVIARSAAANRKIFGASSSKIYVAAALLNKENDDLSTSQMQKMADMLVVSSNTAWTALQKDIGDGSSNRGREYIHNFTRALGQSLTRGYQGYWGSVHGNELVPDESVEMLYDTYHRNFPGAETLWKVMYTCRTGSSKGRKYIPKSILVGGKTGTYSGPTENPATGKQYTVKVRNHILTFNVKGTQYGLAVFANTGTDESSALLAGGLIREYTEL